jgi:hypothetical protein
MNLYYSYASSLLSLVCGTGVEGKPATLAFGLTSVAPTNNSITEVSNVGAYARQALAPNSAGVPFSGVNSNWNFPTPIISGICYNNLQITFPVVTASIGMVSGAFIADTTTYNAGRNLFYTTLPIAKDLEVNDQLYLPISGVQLRFW